MSPMAIAIVAVWSAAASAMRLRYGRSHRRTSWSAALIGVLLWQIDVSRTADLVVSSEPLHETAHRGLLLSLTMAGRRAHALRHFERLTTLLRDLELEPEEEWFGGEYIELVPNERLRYTDRFDDPGLPGEMVTAVTLKKVSVGTELNVVQEGVPDVIPAEACYLGWQESLVLLGKLVEAEIPD